MPIRRLVLAACSAISVTLAYPVNADPAPAAENYVADVRQQVAFLSESSRLASRRAASDKIRAFAETETSEQRRAARDLQIWDRGRLLSSFGPSMLVATNATETAADGPDTIMTGRSAAVDAGPSTEWSRPDPGVSMVSPGAIVMPELDKLQGKDFDTLYKKTQAISLRELAGFYEAYSLTGKDETLRAMAKRELPLVKQRLAELEAL